MRPALIILFLVLPVAACGLDDEQARLCRQVLGVIDPGAQDVTASRLARPQFGVRLHYRPGGADPVPSDAAIACEFAGGAFGLGRFDLVRVEATDGRLSDMQLFWLRRVLDMRQPFLPRAGDDAPMPEALPWLYLLQQLSNAITVSCVYGLLAIGFTLVYGIIGKINLAFGEMYMIGAIVTMIWTKIFVAAGAGGLALGLFAILSIAMVTTAGYGWMTHRTVFRPLHASVTQAPLIAAIGLSLFLREGTRLLHGAGNYWLRPPFPDVITLAGNTAFPVTVTLSQGLVLGLTAVTYGALVLLLRATPFGRMQRACADDSGMAALLGVNVERIVAATFVIGAAAAGVAGFIVAQHYGVANFHMGVVLGFKALTAAVLGGIGSVRGAMLGGLVIGLIETFWSGYLSIAYRDVAVFAVLVGVLIFRPQGLMGGRPNP